MANRRCDMGDCSKVSCLLVAPVAGITQGGERADRRPVSQTQADLLDTPERTRTERELGVAAESKMTSAAVERAIQAVAVPPGYYEGLGLRALSLRGDGTLVATTTCPPAAVTRELEPRWRDALRRSGVTRLVVETAQEAS